MVYHANYLRYFERARTEWLRALDSDAQTLKRDFGVAFTVRRMEIDFIKPARMDDLLDVSVLHSGVKRVQFMLDQEACLAGEPIARARVQVVCVNCADFAPAPIPSALLSRLGA